jgi:hypothetical protein
VGSLTLAALAALLAQLPVRAGSRRRADRSGPDSVSLIGERGHQYHSAFQMRAPADHGTGDDPDATEVALERDAVGVGELAGDALCSSSGDNTARRPRSSSITSGRGIADMHRTLEVATSCSVSDPGSGPQICVLKWCGDGRVRRIGLRRWERVRQ